MMEKIRKNSDALVALILLIFCSIVLSQILIIRTPESRILPYAAVALIAAASIWLVIRTLVFHKSPYALLLHKRRELIVWGFFAGLVLLIRWVGFYPAAFLFSFACHLFLRGKFCRQNILFSLIYSVALVAAIWLVFSLLLRMPLPTGSLFN